MANAKETDVKSSTGVLRLASLLNLLITVNCHRQCHFTFQSISHAELHRTLHVCSAAACCLSLGSSDLKQTGQLQRLRGNAARRGPCVHQQMGLPQSPWRREAARHLVGRTELKATLPITISLLALPPAWPAAPDDDPHLSVLFAGPTQRACDPTDLLSPKDPKESAAALTAICGGSNRRREDAPAGPELRDPPPVPGR